MKIPPLLIKIAPYVGLIVLGILLFQQCDRTAELKQERKSVETFLNDSVSYYKTKAGKEIAQKKALQGSKQALEILLSKQVDSTQQLRKLVSKFKSVDVAANIKTITKFDTVHVPYSSNVESVPFQKDFNRQTEHYSISGTVNESGIKFNAPEIYNTLSLAIGKKKTGLFQSEYRVEAVNSNPHVKTTGLDAYTFTDNKGLISLDAQAGYGMTIYGTSPYAGIGVGFDLWQFLKNVLGFR